MFTALICLTLLPFSWVIWVLACLCALNIACLSASLMAMFSHRLLSFSAFSALLSGLSCCAYRYSMNKSYSDKVLNTQKREILRHITFLLFWNQNLICLGAKPYSLLSWFLCLSSGWGHSLKRLQEIQTIIRVYESKKKRESSYFSWRNIRDTKHIDPKPQKPSLDDGGAVAGLQIGEENPRISHNTIFLYEIQRRYSITTLAITQSFCMLYLNI